MRSTIQDYLAELKGKRVAVIGIGVSNTPLIKMLLRAGIRVTACDNGRNRSSDRCRSREDRGDRKAHRRPRVWPHPPAHRS